MRAFEGPVTDPMLVDVIARYVAERYPDTFELLIYDPSFPEEYREVLERAFCPNAVPGIEFVLLHEPEHEVYVRHLEEGSPGVVGIGFEPEPNRFAVGRSAVIAEELRGWPVDLANTSHDAFGSAAVWETFLRFESERWQMEVEDLIPFETSIVPIPIREADGEPQPDDPGYDPGRDPRDPFDPGEPEPEPDPDPVLLPNLWVTDMTGCWTWSNDGRERVVAPITGIVHNGGQASASGVRASITAGGGSTTVLVGTIGAGGQKAVTATIDVGSIDVVGRPVSTSITADPSNTIAEADESNNTTDSAFAQAGGCI
ncbi:hypothetical protein JW848_08670 [Candidatus Bipolaricaulota bacterium]|nr:hypothetical protein [Candidatus Bipolaricaulota bacterium]